LNSQNSSTYACVAASFTSRQHCATHFTGCPCLSALRSKLRWWHDCIHGRSPLYFCSPIVSVPFRSRLRSADNDDMTVPSTRTARYGPRSFRVAASQIWNMLPPHLRILMLVVNSSNRALRLGSLCKPTHKRRLWTSFKRRFTNTLQIWLIDWLKMLYCFWSFFFLKKDSLQWVIVWSNDRQHESSHRSQQMKLQNSCGCYNRPAFFTLHTFAAASLTP